MAELKSNHSNQGSRLLALCSIAALVWTVAARVFGPSDAYDRAQPKTLAYTTDMLVSGDWQRWILPQARGEEPATKPPLYNWLAAPVVKLAGFSSEIAHKWPSVAALALCWLAIVRLGRSLDPPGGALGWLASMIFLANYMVFKLGYLARPDMLLTLWLLLGWIAATALLSRASSVSARADAESSLRIAAAFWLCVGLAGLTKGPTAMLLILYALIGARVVAGRWRAAGAFGWTWGLPLSLAMIGLWVYGVWRIDPHHLIETLWKQEFLGRVTGTGPEGTRHGPMALLSEYHAVALMFLSRFAPWSICAIAAMVVLWWRDRTSGLRGWRSAAAGSAGTGIWLHAAGVFVLTSIVFFTLSAGKRADYVAVAFAPGAMLAAWWLLSLQARFGRVARWLGPAAAAVIFPVMTVVNLRQPNAPVRDFGPQIMRFVGEVSDVLARERREVVFYNSGATHMKAMLGFSEPDSFQKVNDLIGRGRPFWLIAGRASTPPEDFGQFLTQRDPSLHVTAVVRSAELVWGNDWPSQVTLFDVTPPASEP